MAGDWYGEFFTGMALEVWRAANPPAVTRAEAAFLERELDLEPGSRLLDVPCGNGRLALELARRGYRLTGLDQAGDFLAEGEQAAREAGLEIAWRVEDMRNLPRLSWPASFDGALCFGNSFGYHDREGTAAFLAGLGAALRPGGRLALDTAMTAESILPELEPGAEGIVEVVGGIRMEVTRRHDPARGRIEARYTFTRESGGSGPEIPTGTQSGIQGESRRETRCETRRETRRAWYWVFSVEEIRRLLAAAGLATIEMYGDLDGTPYVAGMPRLLLIAEKVREG